MSNRESTKDQWDNRTLPSVDEIAAQFPQLEIRRLIGRGGMGAIYLARQTALDRDVALKIIAKEVCSDPMFVERFEREAKTLAKLSHPNIVNVYDFGRTSSGMAYLIMEFVDGVNLREALATKSVGAEDALSLVATLCQALDYAHSKGVVHRDIKPENILLGEDGSLKIADFGIAKIVDDPKRSPTLTATRQVLGSLHYLAPEQIEAPEQVDHRVDLYALGVIFYELLTGQLPLGNFEPPSSVLPRIDKRVDAIVMKTLSRKPSARYQNASQLRSDIQQINSENHPVPMPIIEPRPDQLVSVPFHQETFGGLGRVYGSVQSNGDSIKIEYRVTDAILGGIKSQLHQVDIPRNMISHVKLEGFINAKLTIFTHSASVLGNLPGSETGRIELYIERRDREMAAKVVTSLGFSTALDPASDKRWNPTQAALLIVCGVLNGGFIATLQTLVAQADSEYRPVMAVGISVVYGMLIFLQIFGGILHLTSGVFFPFRVAMIVSMLPITPFVLFSAPLAIWHFIETNVLQTKPKQTEDSKSWGATTIVFIRENRTARLISLANLVALGVLVIGSSIYLTGMYPVRIRYRAVGLILGNVDPGDCIANRLSEYADVRVRSIATNRFEVRAWAKDKNLVTTSLKIVKSPTLTLVLAKDYSEEDVSAKVAFHSLAAGVDASNALTKKDLASGPTVGCLDLNRNLDADYVKSLQFEADPNNLSQRVLHLEFSSAGRTAMTQLLQTLQTIDPDAIVSVAMVIDGVVHGITKIDDRSNQQLDLRLSNALSADHSSISAAIRGPELPFDLELLQ